MEGVDILAKFKPALKLSWLECLLVSAHYLLSSSRRQQYWNSILL